MRFADAACLIRRCTCLLFLLAEPQADNIRQGLGAEQCTKARVSVAPEQVPRATRLWVLPDSNNKYDAHCMFGDTQHLHARVRGSLRVGERLARSRQLRVQFRALGCGRTGQRRRLLSSLLQRQHACQGLHTLCCSDASRCTLILQCNADGRS